MYVCLIYMTPTLTYRFQLFTIRVGKSVGMRSEDTEERSPKYAMFYICMKYVGLFDVSGDAEAGAPDGGRSVSCAVRGGRRGARSRSR